MGINLKTHAHGAPTPWALGATQTRESVAEITWCGTTIVGAACSTNVLSLNVILPLESVVPKQGTAVTVAMFVNRKRAEFAAHVQKSFEVYGSYRVLSLGICSPHLGETAARKAQRRANQ